MLGALARFCFRHRRLVVLAWLAVFLGGMVLAVKVFSRLERSRRIIGLREHVTPPPLPVPAHAATSSR